YEVQESAIDRNIEQHSPESSTSGDFFPNKAQKKNCHHAWLDKSPVQLEEKIEPPFKFADDRRPQTGKNHDKKGDYPADFYGVFGGEIGFEKGVVDIDREYGGG